MAFKLNAILYKWLPIIFGCHCRSDRSFFWKGKQFPICARCTGEAVGMLVCIPLFFFWRPSVPVSILLMIPMIVDGFTQSLTKYESTNLKRFLTGFLFGIGLVSFVADTMLMTFHAGQRYGRQLRKNGWKNFWKSRPV